MLGIVREIVFLIWRYSEFVSIDVEEVLGSYVVGLVKIYDEDC